jgi:multicomponent K+:H+ antiporter subunit E
VVIPRLTVEFWPDAPRLAKPGVALRLFAVFAWDILVANFAVAKLVLGPNDKLRPAFIEIPLDIDDPMGIAILASMITLTPGTLSAQVRETDKILVVHGIDIPNKEEAIADIKQRYEAPLKEAMGC